MVILILLGQGVVEVMPYFPNEMKTHAKLDNPLACFMLITYTVFSKYTHAHKLIHTHTHSHKLIHTHTHTHKLIHTHTHSQ